MEDQQRKANRHMPSEIIKRSVKIGGIHTSVSLEEQFWIALKEIAATRRATVVELISAIDRERDIALKP
jgi:predicted DNA-binding ribbon-helix-helix protein